MIMEEEDYGGEARFYVKALNGVRECQLRTNKILKTYMRFGALYCICYIQNHPFNVLQIITVFSVFIIFNICNSIKTLEIIVHYCQLLKCNLIEAKFDKFARIWIQHQMWLRGIIIGIVFKLDRQFDAYSAVWQKQLLFANDKELPL